MEFTRNGITLVFFRKADEKKFSFLIRGNEELTSKLLDSVSKKRVNEQDIKYAVNGIFEKIEELGKSGSADKETQTNITDFNSYVQFCQKTYKSSPSYRTVSVMQNPDIITIEVTDWDGEKYESVGTSKKNAIDNWVVMERGGIGKKNASPIKSKKSYRAVAYEFYGHIYGADSIDGAIEHLRQNGYAAVFEDGKIYEIGEYYPVGSYSFV